MGTEREDTASIQSCKWTRSFIARNFIRGSNGAVQTARREHLLIENNVDQSYQLLFFPLQGVKGEIKNKVRKQERRGR